MPNILMSAQENSYDHSKIVFENIKTFTNEDLLTFQSKILKNTLNEEKFELIFKSFEKKRPTLVKNFKKGNFPVPAKSRKSISNVSTDVSVCLNNNADKSKNSDFLDEEMEILFKNFEEKQNKEAAIENLFRQKTIEKRNSLEPVFFSKNSMNSPPIPENFEEKYLNQKPANSQVKKSFTMPENFTLSEKKMDNNGLKSLKLGSNWHISHKGRIAMEVMTHFLVINQQDKTINFRRLNSLCQKLIDFCESNPDLIKNNQAESLAGAILLLASTDVGLSKAKFLESLKSFKKQMYNKVEFIKRIKVYKSLKEAFLKIRNDL